MTERERMLNGEPYRSRDPELLGLYHRAKILLDQYSRTPSKDADDKQRILAELLGQVGLDVWIEAPFFCDYGVNIRIGGQCFINYNCVFLDSNTITIGTNVLIGPAVQLYTATHPLLPEERIRAGEPGYITRALPITIGDQVWIGGGAMVMPGVSIGSGSTVGAGSVVTKDIPERCFAAGNPCRILRQL
jgi:maltose O-acetyltransferase